MPPHRNFAVGVLAFAALAMGHPGDARARSQTLEPCHVRGVRAMAHCLTLQLPERWDHGNNGRRIAVHVAVVPAAGGVAEPDPVFVLAGGPGQAAGELGRALDAIFGKVRRNRELILMDRRGTGRSAPLTCPLPDGVELTGDAWRPAGVCLHKLDADLAGYDSAAVVRDVEAVRKALGYERINLWAASYGTRVALLYARAHPDRLRTMVLDGVLPPSWNLFEREPLSSQAALDKTFAACAADRACAKAFPDLPGTLKNILARLDEGPKEFAGSPETGKPAAISRQAFMQNLRVALYRPLYAAAIPFLIHSFAAGDARPLIAFTHEVDHRIVEHMYLGLTLSVLCTEEIARADPEAISAAGARSLFRTAYFDFWRQACDGWPRARLAPEYGAPVHAEMPVLLLSGALDPVTPPAAAEEAARTLSHATHFIAPAAGHNVSAFGCAPDLLADFISAADASQLDPSCLAERDRPPFLVGLRGPRP